MTLVLFRRRAWGAAWSGTEGWGARSKKPSEGSHSRVRRTRPMDLQSIFGWKSLPEAGFGKNVVIDADRCSGSRIYLDHPNAGRSVVQDHSSDHRFKRLHLTRASVRRASGFVLTGKPDCDLKAVGMI